MLVNAISERISTRFTRVNWSSRISSSTCFCPPPLIMFLPLLPLHQLFIILTGLKCQVSIFICFAVHYYGTAFIFLSGTTDVRVFSTLLSVFHSDFRIRQFSRSNPIISVVGIVRRVRIP